MSDGAKAGFQVLTGRDEKGNTVPVIRVVSGETDILVMMTRGDARRMALDIMEVEASCDGRQIQAVERQDGNYDS